MNRRFYSAATSMCFVFCLFLAGCGGGRSESELGEGSYFYFPDPNGKLAREKVQVFELREDGVIWVKTANGNEILTNGQWVLQNGFWW